MKRGALLLLLALAGCGTNPQDSRTRVQVLAAHEEQIATRARAAARSREPLVLQELLTEARLGQEDIEQTVPFGEPGREEALRRAREVVESISVALQPR